VIDGGMRGACTKYISGRAGFLNTEARREDDCWTGGEVSSKSDRFKENKTRVLMLEEPGKSSWEGEGGRTSKQRQRDLPAWEFNWN